ncbi:carbon monoxide dehydrogenase [Sulfolobus sp. E5-1-F]|uniref:SRPBCC domain-containing protein n=1 Tax=Sulfolobaceae TaxID=118883 RepID=UPI00129589CE|nr:MULTISPECIES: SRPBCC domain-containing protein [unclassified Sulfolobus]QGA53568.1 carbon monoxide dehydrogenase [Sulfolobus sp. E5-1-F]QGA68765.1 carbon monoxide dehydrogenase [Sulfolobus sp. E11-6]
MTKTEGEIMIKDPTKAKQFFSDYKNLLTCIPGVKEINGNSFKAYVKFSFLTIEINGTVKTHEVNGDNIDTLITIEGPGIIASINTLLTILGNKIKWSSDYEVSGPLANSLKKHISSQAEEISKQIVECSVGKISQ